MRGEGVENFVKLRRLAETLKTTPNDILEIGGRSSAAPKVDLAALQATIAGAFQSLADLGQAEANELAELLLEDAAEPLGEAEADLSKLRRSLGGLTVRRFLRKDGGKF